MNILELDRLNKVLKRRAIVYIPPRIQAMMTGVTHIRIKRVTLTAIYEDGTQKSIKDQALCESLRYEMIRRDHPELPEKETPSFLELISKIQSERKEITL